MVLHLYVRLIASAGAPALVVRPVVLGHGASVNPDSIYIPTIENCDQHSFFLLYNMLYPSALRADGSVQRTDLSVCKSCVQIDDPIKLKDRPDIGEGEYVSQYGCRYRVNAQKFGLQRFSDMVLQVEGHCVTEYGWRSDFSTAATKDSYYL